jgi:hypothetical protein
MKFWSLTFATQMLFRRSGSELFDTFKSIILLRIFPLQNIYSWKMLRKIKWQIPGEHLTARYNWYQGPVPDRIPAVEKHCFTGQFCKARIFVDRNTFNKFCILKFTITAQMYEYLMQFISSAIPWKLSLGFHGSPYVLFSETHISRTCFRLSPV